MSVQDAWSLSGVPNGLDSRRGRHYTSLSPSKMPPAGMVSHETMRILRWSPAGYIPEETTPLPRKRRTRKNIQATGPQPFAHAEYSPSLSSSIASTPVAYQRLPGTIPGQGYPLVMGYSAVPVDASAASLQAQSLPQSFGIGNAPPPPLTTVIAEQGLPPIEVEQQNAVIEVQRLKAERRKLEQLKEQQRQEKERALQTEKLLQEQVERRLDDLSRQRQAERDAERRREWEWTWMKKRLAIEMAADADYRDVILEERRERDWIEDDEKRDESALRFKELERAEQREEERRMRIRMDLLQREADLQCQLRVAALMKEETSSRRISELLEQKERGDVVAARSYLFAFIMSIEQKLFTEAQEEECERRLLAVAEEQEVGAIVREHRHVLEEETKLQEIERAELANMVTTALREEQEFRWDLELEERMARRDIGEALTRVIELFILSLQQMQSAEEELRQVLEHEEALEERIQELLDACEDAAVEVETAERQRRRELEEMFYFQADEVAYVMTVRGLTELQAAEREERLKLLREEERLRQWPVRMQLLWLDEAGERMEVVEAEDYGRQQLELMEAMAKRMEEGINREREQEKRLGKLEKQDAVVRASQRQATRTAAATLIQSAIRMYLSKKRLREMKTSTTLKHRHDNAEWQRTLESQALHRRMPPQAAPSPSYYNYYATPSPVRSPSPFSGATSTPTPYYMATTSSYPGLHHYRAFAPGHAAASEGAVGVHPMQGWVNPAYPPPPSTAASSSAGYPSYPLRPQYVYMPPPGQPPPHGAAAAAHPYTVTATQTPPPHHLSPTGTTGSATPTINRGHEEPLRRPASGSGARAAGMRRATPSTSASATVL